MRFRGYYEFLSNFYECPITIPFGNEELTFRNSEAAFQACKCPERAKDFLGLKGADAKRLGKSVPLRSNWESIKDACMLLVLRKKFEQNPNLMDKLVRITDYIEETNTWWDTYWGVCEGHGQNRLGFLLMQVQDEERARRNMN